MSEEQPVYATQTERLIWKLCNYDIHNGPVWDADEIVLEAADVISSQRATIAQQRELIAEMENALLGALPFVEDALLDEGYKKDSVRESLKEIKDALTRAKEYTNEKV